MGKGSSPLSLNPMNIYIALVLTIISNTFANTLIKVAMNKADKTQGLINQYLFNPYFIAGVILFALSLISYSITLTKMKLSVAYPVIISACFVLVVFISWFYLKERISLIQLTGIALIVIGIWLVLK
jgi:multidrug transporter EmrE-like cation transporter